MKKFCYCGRSSTGEISFHFEGDYEVNKDCGNETEFIIQVKEGQFGCTEVDFVDDGVRIKITGAWEMTEFLSAMVDIAKRLNVTNDNIEKIDKH